MNKSGIDHLKDPRLNKGTAFTLEEREQLGLQGILPPLVSTLEQQVERALANIRRKNDPIDQYIFLAALQKRNERLFFRLLIDHLTELMPIVYTPTVGLACQEYANIFRDASGFYLSSEDKGRIEKTLSNWPEKDIRLIVVTDGERILGLGDLGTNGMGIPIGKLALYCACAGVDPSQCLPIVLDVGTENEELKKDPLYLGLRQNRVRDQEYDDFIEEFILAVKSLYPNALLQFEDFATDNAVTLLDRYRDRLLCFNDDIQGTASVALAGLYAATKLTKLPLSEMRFMFVGAGSAATGIGDLLVKALELEGLSQEEARKKLIFNDRKGLVTRCRDSLKPHVAHFASDLPPSDYAAALKAFKPHVLIGATGTPALFTKDIIETMADLNETPIIFALSNPTSRAECTAEEAYKWSDGKAIFASGSPFGVVHVNGEIRVPGQGNNAYIFPGLGLGALHGGARRITDNMLIAAAQTLAANVSQNQLDQGCLYPPLEEIRTVSLKIAASVAESAKAEGLIEGELPDNFEEYVNNSMYDPYY